MIDDTLPPILIVEDDVVLARLFGALLARTGRPVVTVPTIAAARQAVAQGGLGLVLLDLMLPDGDGRTLLAEVRSHFDALALPVIVVAGPVPPAVAAECYELGVETLLTKPVDPILFGAAVENVLRRQRATGVSPPSISLDPVTRLPTRPALVGRAREIVAAAHAREMRAVVALIEVGGLPELEASRGRDVADAAMREAAQLLAHAAHGGVTVRWEGTRLAALWPAGSVEDGLAHFRTMRHSERGVRLRCGVVELRDAAALDEAIGECDACILRAARQRAEQDAAARVPALDAPPIVLLAEDDELTARLLAHRLEREGMILVRAADGHAASELLATAEFDLAVFDVMLPGRDGYELLAQLRGTPATATRPALMLTGRTAEADIARALELGADDYVVKPFSPVELMARIRRLLHRRAPNAA